MIVVFDFCISALPWIGIGLFVACSCVMAKAKAEGSKMSRLFRAISWSPAGCFVLVAFMEMCRGNTSGATTWLVLGVFNAVINYASAQ